MRAAFALALIVAMAAIACDRGKPAGEPQGSAGSTAPFDDSEQARFDSERRPDKLVEALALKPGSRVADIGAGSGLLTVHLARAVAPNGKVIATDVDGAVLDLLAQRLKAAKLDGVVEPRVVAADTPGLEPGAYDAILLAEVDHFFSDPVAWLKSAAAALKPGGRIVLSNRIHHRTASLAAVQKAGLVVKNESSPMPSHFIAVLVAAPGKP